MVIISKTILVEFGAKHSDAVEALNKWYDISKLGKFGRYKERF